ncbi:MAG: SDR family NAD(P)-dependent oxidoreductase [Woeseiaceae bacterium]|jgi:NAD(P)-dependent dehydrogenase (short-subunit alcohol dehydrogenase family)|nr:SDR family NAD(P)-dependent oxidoreductase [Woeseiaceae bacterium]
MHVIVTGAAGALGRDVAALLAKAGHKVTGIDIAESLESVNGLSVGIGSVDLGNATAVETAIEEAVDRSGPIDGLVNIAGGFAWETIADGSPDTWDRMYAMNVRTALNVCRAALPHLAGSASIVNVGAGAADKAGMGMGAYAASKAGVHRLTEALAEELKDKGTRVNAILPSIIDTPANRKDMPDADFASWVKTEELGNVIRFLLSAEASGVTGALIAVPGRV